MRNNTRFGMNRGRPEFSQRMSTHGQSGNFSPAAMFLKGEKGAWYEPNDLTTLFQDAAQTTPCTAAGQLVGCMRDKSGAGNHLTTSGGGKPTLRNTGSLWYLEFDGVGNNMACADNVTFRNAQMSFFIGVNPLALGASEDWIACGNAGTFPTNNWTLSNTSTSFAVLPRLPSGSYDVITAISASTPIVVSVTSDAGVPLLRSRVNAVQASDHATTLGTTDTTGFFLGCHSGGGALSAMYFFGLVLRNAISSATEIVAMEKYMGRLTGVPL